MGKGVMLVRMRPLESTSGFTCTTDIEADTAHKYKTIGSTSVVDP